MYDDEDTKKSQRVKRFSSYKPYKLVPLSKLEAQEQADKVVGLLENIEYMRSCSILGINPVKIPLPIVKMVFIERKLDEGEQNRGE